MKRHMLARGAEAANIARIMDQVPVINTAVTQNTVTIQILFFVSLVRLIACTAL